MFSSDYDIAKWDGFTADKAMEETLAAACRYNLAHMPEPADSLPDDLSCFSDMFLSDALAFISYCAESLLFCCTLTFARSPKFKASTETFSRVSKDNISYSIGSSLACGEALYKLDDDDRISLVDYIIDELASRLSDRGFSVSVTAHGDSLRIYVSWCTDKEAAGYIYHITDYSQIDAIKCGVPASDVFA